jgi:hypothetical protein
MNWVFWPIGEEIAQGIWHLLCRDFDAGKCYLCAWTNLSPMYLDYTVLKHSLIAVRAPGDVER